MASAAALACSHVHRLNTNPGDNAVINTVRFVNLDGLSDHLLAMPSSCYCRVTCPKVDERALHSRLLNCTQLEQQIAA